jgi:hypothetical protein
MSHPSNILGVNTTIISYEEYGLLSSLLCHILIHPITCCYVHIFFPPPLSFTLPLYMDRQGNISNHVNSHVRTTDMHRTFCII